MLLAFAWHYMAILVEAWHHQRQGALWCVSKSADERIEEHPASTRGSGEVRVICSHPTIHKTFV